MKIEKINDRQIRCVLTKEDLESRKIRLSELVCGGEKARNLLRDMIVRAARELNFSFNNNPLMIEAVPTGKGQLVLTITRVDDPGELSSRFHHLPGLGDFEKQEGYPKEPAGEAVASYSSADDILNVLKRFSKKLEELKDKSSGTVEVTSSAEEPDVPEVRMIASKNDMPGGGVAASKNGAPGAGPAVLNASVADEGAGASETGVPGTGTDASVRGVSGAGASEHGEPGTGAGASEHGEPGTGAGASENGMSGTDIEALKDTLLGAGLSALKNALSDPGRGIPKDAIAGVGVGMPNGRLPGAEKTVQGSKGTRKAGEILHGLPGAAGAGSGRRTEDSSSEENARKAIEKEMYRYTRFYLFRSLGNVLDASKRVPEGYTGENALYKNPDDGAFYLLVRKADTEAEQFNRICNVLSEYSMPMDYSTGMDEFFREHMQVIIADSALQHLRNV